MRTQLLTSLGICLLGLRALAQPGILSILQTEDNQTKVITLATNEVVEILTAYDFYGAGSLLTFQQGKIRVQVVPGNAAGGLPHCLPYPFHLAGPAELTVQTGNSQGARTETTPLLVTLEIRRIRPATLPVRPPDAKLATPPSP